MASCDEVIGFEPSGAARWRVVRAWIPTITETATIATTTAASTGINTGCRPTRRCRSVSTRSSTNEAAGSCTVTSAST
jgi:hypothetical protein